MHKTFVLKPRGNVQYIYIYIFKDGPISTQRNASRFMYTGKMYINKYITLQCRRSGGGYRGREEGSAYRMILCFIIFYIYLIMRRGQVVQVCGVYTPYILPYTPSVATATAVVVEEEVQTWLGGDLLPDRGPRATLWAISCRPRPFFFPTCSSYSRRRLVPLLLRHPYIPLLSLPDSPCTLYTHSPIDKNMAPNKDGENKTWNKK